MHDNSYFVVANVNPILMPESIGVVKSTSLDQFIQVLEISFVFLLVYSLITLFDAAINIYDLYKPIASDFLGDQGVGSLNGGHWELIIRITVVFNILLFAFSLVFGIWMRKTRDGWSFNQLGFTFRTPNYSFRDLVERGIVLGFLVVVINYTVMTLVFWVYTGSFQSAVLNIHSFSQSNGQVFTPHQLKAEFYFGFVEMGLVWPLSAGFFFFAYTHNSLAAKFDRGIANVLSSLFYVYYLLFFFMIPGEGKLQVISDPNFWTLPVIFQSLVFLVILYISFSAFAETRSIVLPFLLNFVLNVVLTIFKAGNSMLYDSYTPLMLIPYFVSIMVLVVYYMKKKKVFSTIMLGINDVKNSDIPFVRSFGYSVIFIFLSFIVPGILEYFTSKRLDHGGTVALISALIYIFIILIAVIILTYEPTEVWDVLLTSEDGRPISSHIELFESDEVLISGFFAALSSVSEEMGGGKSELKSVKRGDREILIQDGVLSKIIALVDKDQPSIRNAIERIHKEFEVRNSDKLKAWTGSQMPSADEMVKQIGDLSIKFSIPQQTRWVATLTLIFGPLMIILLGLIL